MKIASVRGIKESDEVYPMKTINLLLFCGIIFQLGFSFSPPSALSAPSEAEPSFKPKVIKIKLSNPNSTLYVGVTQPDGSIHYFEKGLGEINSKIITLLFTRDKTQSTLGRINDMKTHSGAPQLLTTHFLSEEFIPPLLRGLGIGLSHFMLPLESFSPEKIRENYTKVNAIESLEAPINANSIIPGIFRLAAPDFDRAMSIFSEIYHFRFFRLIRSAALQDEIQQMASSALDWSFEFGKYLAFLYGGRLINKVWLGIFSSAKMSTLATFFTLLLADQTLRANLSETHASENEAENLRAQLAVELWGEGGKKYLLENQNAMAELIQANRLPELSSLLKHPTFQSTLLNPMNHYNVAEMNRTIGNIEPKQTTLNFSTILQRVDDPKALERVLTEGSKSKLWRDMFRWATLNNPSLEIQIVSLEAGQLGHSEKGRIRLSAEVVRTNPARAAWILGHEFWHVSKISYRDSEIFRYYDKGQYIRAYASEEVLALYVGHRIRSEIFSENQTFLEDISALKEFMMLSHPENMVSLYANSQLMWMCEQMAQRSQTNFWNNWRGDSVQ